MRVAGDFAHKEPGDVHMEQGGETGALVLFSLYAPEGEGRLVESLNKDGSINHISTCLLYTSPSPRDLSTSRMPSSA